MLDSMPVYSKQKSSKLYEKRAQHFVVCEDCETGPAQFYCKSCHGRLCEECKVSHETKKITRGHKLISLSEYFESLCDENDTHENEEHSARVVKKQLRMEQNTIESKLIPALNQRLTAEHLKKSRLSSSVTNLSDEFENRCKELTKMISEIKDNYIEKLEKSKEKIFDELNQTIGDLEGNIKKLETRSSEINKHLGLKDKEMIQKKIENIEEETLFPRATSVVTEDFCPSKLEKESVQKIFGHFPEIILK